MTALNNIFLIGAVLVALLGGACDLRSARIPNWLTYSGLLSALLFRSTVLGWSGLKNGAIGMGVAGLFLFILFAIGAMGGGDVKLMAAVGAWTGAQQVVLLILSALLAGGLLAIVYVIFSQGVRRTLRNIFDLICFCLTSGLIPHPLLNVCEPGTLRVPFGVAIAIGSLFCAGNAIWWR